MYYNMTKKEIDGLYNPEIAKLLKTKATQTEEYKAMMKLSIFIFDNKGGIK